MKASKMTTRVRTSVKHPLSLKELGAKAWIGRGAGIIPLKEQGKTPINKGGSKAPFTDWKIMQDVLKDRPEANYGIVTGEVSGLFVLDRDGPEGRASLRALEEKHGPLPPTVTVVTPRGRHYYYKHPGRPVKNSAGRLGTGIDVRGERGYVVGVGSTHPTGKIYKYAKNLGPKSLAVAAAPEWLLTLVAGDGTPAPNNDRALTTIPVDGRTHMYAQSALLQELDNLRKAPIHQRNDTLNRCAFKLGQLVGQGLLEVGCVTSELARCARTIGLDELEIESTIRSGLQAGQSSPRSLPSLGGTQADLSTREVPAGGVNDELTKELSALGETDTHNAERFARRFGAQVMYTPGRGLMTYSDGRWQPDSMLRCMALAKETARLIAIEAHALTDDNARAARIRFSKASLSKTALDRMLELAKGLLAVEDKKLDINPWLFNVQNGTVDLRSGTLLSHRPADRLTKIASVSYDSKADCPTFKHFLGTASRGDTEFVAYQQRAVGYTLTASTIEQVFFLLKGPGQTGKSTFLEVIRNMVGDYGLHTPSESLLAKQYDNSIPSDLARLVGARMVTAVEANWTRQIDEARLKALTGGDPITARFLRHDYFQFSPQLKLWFAVNDFPGVRGTAGAFWRRVRVIPFTVQIPAESRDDHLLEKLMAELPGILNWAIAGCLSWQRDGLGSAAAVTAASAQWKQASDHVKKFINEMLVFENDRTIQASELYSQFRSWCLRNGETVLTDRQLKAAFEEADLSYKRSRTGSVWVGVKLRQV